MTRLIHVSAPDLHKINWQLVNKKCYTKIKYNNILKWIIHISIIKLIPNIVIIAVRLKLNILR